jgi:uncharacterized protein YegJ (DUF2314 family)
MASFLALLVSMRWTRVVVAGLILVAATGLAWWLQDRGRFLTAIFVVASGFAAARWVWGKLTPVEMSEDDPPMVSLVLLLNKPRYLEERVLAEILRSAWGITFSASGDAEKSADDVPGGEPFVVGESPVFMVRAEGVIFCVHNHARLYFDEVDDVAAKVPDLRLRTIILEHRAWLSVDAMGVADGPETTAAYAKIARALAELADDSVLGLFQPASNRLTPWEPGLEARLRAGENLDELFAVTQVPVVQIADDDPRMKAAVAEARQRWPDFVTAFQARKPGGNYAVKAPITREDNTEFIWLEVIGLEPEYVHGKLANDPVALGDLKLGDQVEVPLSELNDWMYRHSEDDEVTGLFTVKILSEKWNGVAGGST